MLFLLFAGLTLASFALVWRGHKRSGAGLASLIVVALVLLASGPLGGALVTSVQSNAVQKPELHWEGRNMIVVFGAGTTRVPIMGVEPSIFAQGRLLEVVALFRGCTASFAECTIVVSGGDVVGSGRTEASIYAEELVRLGVKPHSITLDEASANTWQSAERISSLARARSPDQIVLVTSAYHMRRAQLYLRHFGLNAIGVRADYMAQVPGVVTLAYNFAVAEVAVHEAIGTARYHVYNQLGFNTPAVK